MSYEGYEEWLCNKGHYTTTDCSESAPVVCKICGEGYKWRHSVDVTNGYDEEYASTSDAPKTEVGFDDIWHTDHYNNRYATKALRYTPAPDAPWIDFVEERARQEREIAELQATYRWILFKSHDSLKFHDEIYVGLEDGLPKFVGWMEQKAYLFLSSIEACLTLAALGPPSGETEWHIGRTDTDSWTDTRKDSDETQ